MILWDIYENNFIALSTKIKGHRNLEKTRLGKLDYWVHSVEPQTPRKVSHLSMLN